MERVFTEHAFVADDLSNSIGLETIADPFSRAAEAVIQLTETREAISSAAAALDHLSDWFARLTQHVTGAAEVDIQRIHESTEGIDTLTTTQFVDTPDASLMASGEFVEYFNRLAASAWIVAPILVRGRTIARLRAHFTNTLYPTSRQQILLHALAKFYALVLAEFDQPSSINSRESRQTPAWEIAIDQFCHEVRSPLTSMKMSVQMAQRKLGTLQELAELGDQEKASALIAEMRDLLARVDRNIDLEDRLTADLNQSVRQESRDVDLKPALCDLANVVAQALENIRSVHPDRHVSISICAERIAVNADEDRLTQIVINYLTNAIKYSPPDKPIETHVLIKHGRGRVEVRDFGPGLTQAEQRLIWQRSYRSPSAQKTAGGLGIGLHLCRRLIRAMGGSLGVKSVKGLGSTFWFSLPVVTANG